ncbi:hypothetical protein Rhe02_37240 [Rhizocola hellebori]|uniref:Mycothiol-dependent maleylpyruvate isomerase metal-binding domain-containing protein n=1 Tax=Rhizocola hellebori TaxID=1392758 RepID=A0A8J3Q977_9ACTN|nr:maleylpyruvate isomerase N-terminal domain-containing protein [Rhizocola hellebori]GIH05657.1 hypothetical protein Rhe02_37240 [Rhizocola hellebori]
MIIGVFLATAETVAPLLRTPELESRWHEPSALADFRISGLAGHLARAVLNVERYLDAPVPHGIEPMDAVTYFRTTGADADDPADPIHRVIRERGEQAAEGGPTALAGQYDSARARLGERLSGLSVGQPVLMFDRHVLLLGECLLTRLVELAVHTDDLAVSLGLPTPDVGDQAMDLVVTTLSRISRQRHGSLAVLRAFSRRERTSSNIAAF